MGNLAKAEADGVLGLDGAVNFRAGKGVSRKQFLWTAGVIVGGAVLGAGLGAGLAQLGVGERGNAVEAQTGFVNIADLIKYLEKEHPLEKPSVVVEKPSLNSEEAAELARDFSKSQVVFVVTGQKNTLLVNEVAKKARIYETVFGVPGRQMVVPIVPGELHVDDKGGSKPVQGLVYHPGTRALPGGDKPYTLGPVVYIDTRDPEQIDKLAADELSHVFVLGETARGNNGFEPLSPPLKLPSMLAGGSETKLDDVNELQHGVMMRLARGKEKILAGVGPVGQILSKYPLFFRKAREVLEKKPDIIERDFLNEMEKMTSGFSDWHERMLKGKNLEMTRQRESRRFVEGAGFEWMVKSEPKTPAIFAHPVTDKAYLPGIPTIAVRDGRNQQFALYGSRLPLKEAYGKVKSGKISAVAVQGTHLLVPINKREDEWVALGYFEK